MIRFVFAFVLGASLFAALGCGAGEAPAFAQAPAQGDAVAPPPARQPQARPAGQPQARPAGEKREIKSPFIRELMRSLDEMQEGVQPEERDNLRHMLEEADAELEKALGENSRNRILAANKRRPAFQVWAKNRGQAPAVPKQPKKVVPGTEPLPPAIVPPAATPMTAPAPMTPPAVKPMPPATDDPFGEPK